MGLACTQLPSATQRVGSMSVSAGGRDGQGKELKTWVSSPALVRPSGVMLGESFLTLGLGFHPLKMEVMAATCLEGSGKVLPGTHGELSVCAHSPPSTTRPLSSSLALNWVT